MSWFDYRAARGDGSLVNGSAVAATGGELIASLLRQGLTPIRVAARAGAGRAASSDRDLAILFRGLASLVGTGLPLERALAACESLALAPTLVRSVGGVRSELHEGRSLSEALEASGVVVPGATMGILRSAERGGRFAAALEDAATQLEAECDAKSRITQALAYPLMLAVAGTLSVVVIGAVVVPRFATLLGEYHQQLPLSTRMLLGAGTALRSYGLLLAVVLALSVLTIQEWARSPHGRQRLDDFWLHVPVIGPLRHTFATARFCRALGAMLASGMPLGPALSTARDALSNTTLSKRLDQAHAFVTEGEPLAKALARNACLTPVALQLVAVGENAGQLAPILVKAAALASAEADQRLRKATTLLEPVLILVFGGLIGLVAIGLLQAVYSLRPGA
jgi:type II secretory pathway component PulF